MKWEYHITTLPRGCWFDGIVEPHFVGADNARIEAHGGCDTLLTTHEGQMAYNHQVADVARTLRS